MTDKNSTSAIAATHARMVSYIWSIADDCLRDNFQRGQYRDIILPLLVLRRMDALLEPTKDDVEQEISETGDPDGFVLCNITGYNFYNTSRWTLQRLYDNAPDSNTLLLANILDYIAGYSPNVKDILTRFNYEHLLRRLADADRLLVTIEKFVDPAYNLTDREKTAPDGTVLPALTNIGMGYVFEELLRRFNEENNEDAGEHFTPREIIRLMCRLVFGPIKDALPPLISFYDPACGTGGMLTQAIDYLTQQLGVDQRYISVYGTEVNPETYAICKSDLLIKGIATEEPASTKDRIHWGNTLSENHFGGMRFNFMLSNPPYGKSWNAEKTKIVSDDGAIIDDRFTVSLPDAYGHSAIEKATPRTSDGQLLFMMEMVGKMKHRDEWAAGSRIATIQNGSALFTGDAGSGESNIRRYLVENDLVDCIVQLPGNIFYNTGITTYLWLLAGNKPESHRGRVMLIDASRLFTPLRKNLGNKNCEISPEQAEAIYRAYERFENLEPTDDLPLEARVFTADEFRYYRIQVERPLRLRCHYDSSRLAPMPDDVKPKQRAKAIEQQALLRQVLDACPEGYTDDWEEYAATVRRACPRLKKVDLAALRRYCCETCPEAKPVHAADGYEPDTALRDYENVPATENINEYFKREVLPYAPDAWIAEGETKIGCEISFTRYFYRPERLREADEITADLKAASEETARLRGLIMEDEA